jgi:mono/diheme cytochrome c family protein
LLLSTAQEEIMQLRKLFWIITGLIAVALVAGAQEQSQKVIKHVPVKATSAASGQEMFTTYCAVCHGLDGKGGGPAAQALRVPPPDLTTLSKRNNGQYPALRVSSTLRGEAELPAHGSKDMPVWGRLFWSMSGGHSSEVQQRVVNLNKYIESLQGK